VSTQPRVVLYGTEFCSYCGAARMLLKKKGIEFEEILVSRDDALREEMQRLSGRRTVPQIFVDGQPIGGFDDLYSLDQDGRLDKLLGRS
jgi:glutaredoxin 3